MRHGERAARLDALLDALEEFDEPGKRISNTTAHAVGRFVAVTQDGDLAWGDAMVAGVTGISEDHWWHPGDDPRGAAKKLIILREVLRSQAKAGQ